MRSFWFMLFGGILMACLAAGVGQSQSGNFKNLQVLPKDISKDDLKATMKGFAEQLGVQCDFCHDVDAGFEKDVKSNKLQGRRMLLLVNEMKNTDKYFPNPEERAKISCWTCHRGSIHIKPPSS